MKRFSDHALRRYWRRVSRLLLAIELLGVLLAVGLGVTIVRYGGQDRAAPSDVIVVLGGGPEGTERRTRHAVALYQQGYAPALLCSGRYTGAGSISEGQRCAAVALAAGVPPAAIFVDEDSRSTEENAAATLALMRAHSWTSALLVSDSYHLWRAHWLFERQGIRTSVSPAQLTSGALGPLVQARAVVREIVAVGWYAGKTLLGLRHTDSPF